MTLRRELFWLAVTSAVWALGYFILNSTEAWLTQPRVLRFTPPDYGDKVFCSGSFNNWQHPDPTYELKDPDKDGVFELMISLPPSRYEYKFFITMKPREQLKQWFEDTGAELEDDGFGGKNSVIRQKAEQTVNFEFKKAPSYAQKIVITGDFDHWAGADRNRKNRFFLNKDKDGVWRGSYPMPAGRTAYKYLVNPDEWNPTANEAWFLDTNNPDTISADVVNPDTKNSILVIHTVKPVIFFFNLLMGSLVFILVCMAPAAYLVRKILNLPLPLTAKFVMVMVSVAGLTAMIIFAVEYHEDRQAVQSELRRQTNIVDAWLSGHKVDFTNLSRPEPRKQLDRALASILHNLVYSWKGRPTYSRYETDINALAIYGPDGKPAGVRLVRILDEGIGDQGLMGSLEKFSPIGIESFTVRQIYKTDYTAILPVRSGNKILYTLLVNFDRQRLEQENRAFIQRKLFTLLILLGIGTLMAVTMSQMLLTPIRQMVSAMGQVKETGFAPRIEIASRDELAELVNAFNTMSSEVKRYHEMQADQLLSEKTKLQGILFSIEDGIVMTDFEGSIMLVNDSAKLMLNINEHFPYTKKFLDYITDEGVREEFREMLEGGMRAPDREFQIPRPNGNLHVRLSRSIVTTAAGKALGWVTVIRDITLEKELENMKDDFVHSITHDLKSPLTSVRGFLKLFIDGDIGELNNQQKHYLGVMDNSTTKVLKLINNILDMAKLEAGKMSLNKNDWNAAASVNQIVESLQGTAHQHNIKLSSQFESDGNENGFHLFADGNLLERVIGNLVDNALKFTPGGGRIDVLVTDTGKRLTVAVRDTGKGIPPDSLDKVFIKFKQVPGTKGGTGLGLTIVKHIVESHGGEITVQSEVGKGTTFSFWVPKETAPEPEKQKA